MNHFLFPASPVLSLFATGTLVLVIECIWPWVAKRLALLLALVGLGFSLFFTYQLWNSGVLETLLAVREPGWLVEFFQSYRLNSTVLLLDGVLATIGLLSVIFVHESFKDHKSFSEILFLMLYVIAGMMLLVSASTLLMVFLSLELLSLPTYVLVGLRRQSRESTEAALKYFLFGSFASVLLVLGSAFLYAQFGTFDLERIAEFIATQAERSGMDWALTMSGLALIVMAVAFKMGLVPFHMWLPDAYQGAPTAVTGFMGSAMKVAAFGLALRILWTTFGSVSVKWVPLMSYLAVATVFVGNLGALTQNNLKRLFAYSAIAHAGYLVLGLLAVSAGTADAHFIVYYLFVYGLMFLGTFALLEAIERSGEGLEVDRLAGMGFSHPMLGACLAVFSLSAAGIPPTAGFFAKYFIFMDAVRGGHTLTVVLVAISTIIGVYYYLRVIVALYMKENSDRLWIRLQPLTQLAIYFCALALLYFGLFPNRLV